MTMSTSSPNDLPGVGGSGGGASPRPGVPGPGVTRVTGGGSGGGFPSAGPQPAAPTTAQVKQRQEDQRAEALKLAVSINGGRLPRATDSDVLTTAKLFYDFIKGNGGSSNA